MAAESKGDWIKLYRSLLDSCVASDDWLCRLWIHLLLLANWKTSWFAGVEIGVGQVAFGQDAFAKELRVHRSTLARGLKKLAELRQIKVENVNNRFTLVSICNWETYQNGKQHGAATDATTAATALKQPANNCATTAATHPKKKEIKEGKKNTPLPPKGGISAAGNTARFLSIWNSAQGVSKIASLNPKRAKSLAVRIKETLTMPDGTEAPWLDALEHAVAKKFPLKCFDNADGFRPDGDFILRPDTLGKILEGKYDWTKFKTTLEIVPI